MPNSSRLDSNHIGYCGGIRYINDGWYIAGMLWQFYASAYYQYSVISINERYVPGSWRTGTTWPYVYIRDGQVVDNQSKVKSHGVVGGAGLEVAFSRYIGLFGEYTYGYSKFSTLFNEDENVEGGRFRFGLTWRTSFL